jgi:hypothetical protein
MVVRDLQVSLGFCQNKGKKLYKGRQKIQDIMSFEHFLTYVHVPGSFLFQSLVGKCNWRIYGKPLELDKAGELVGY